MSHEDQAVIDSIIRERARKLWADPDELEILDSAQVSVTGDGTGHWVTAKVYVPLPAGDPATLTPPWSAEHSEAAIDEGWELFDTQGSVDGPWQIQRLDEPFPGTTVLTSDAVAWALVMQGAAPHHKAARLFIRANNPMQWSLMTEGVIQKPIRNGSLSSSFADLIHLLIQLDTIEGTSPADYMSTSISTSSGALQTTFTLVLTNGYPAPYINNIDPLWENDGYADAATSINLILPGIVHFEWKYTITIEFATVELAQAAAAATGWKAWDKEGRILEVESSGPEGYDHPAIMTNQRYNDYPRTAFCGWQLYSN